MELQTSIEQVAGILHRAGLDFDTHPDGDQYLLRFDDDAVFVTFGEWGEDVLVTITSPVLQEIDAEGAGGVLVSQRIGELNRCHRFVKYLFAEGTLACAYDMLAETLRAADLLNGVRTVARSVDLVASELAPATGGKRFADVCSCPPDDDIPF